MTTHRKTLTVQKSTTSFTTIRQHGLEVNFTSIEEIDNGSYVNFVLEVKKDGITWEVRKRYSEFRFFQQALAEYTHHLTAEFPSKSVSLFNFFFICLFLFVLILILFFSSSFFTYFLLFLLIFTYCSPH